MLSAEEQSRYFSSGVALRTCILKACDARPVWEVTAARGWRRGSNIQVVVMFAVIMGAPLHEAAPIAPDALDMRGLCAGMDCSSTCVSKRSA
ncbi:hypothetical protein IE81DRAFT_243476 [Ceraceosorus guamensis]|uniref:Uncharacterized protein n=1 Tax=Ceraceosorus guamensis TaxID=1522189 RepID=A0A316W855_9BASI|nr:hypothetical protein IE81DRAFT_243476 [Ceraceosorus guamensis]PWN44921.1 hypothetical protein IE81DRAFT_243476 [Ceraceosorus guamensis]